MPCGREIRLRRVKSLRRWGFISFHLMRSGKYHNLQSKLFHREQSERFHLLLRLNALNIGRGACQGSEHRAACGRWSGAPSRKKQRALRSAPQSSVAPYHSLSPLAKTHSLRTSSSPPQNVSILGYPHARRLYFWPYASLVRVQHGAKIKNPVERRDFCFVLFNIYHSLNAHDSNEMHLSDIFEKFVLNKAQLNILMIRMCCLLGYVCL